MCDKCTYLNKNENKECEICQNKKPALNLQISQYWQCKICSFHQNINDCQKCQICGNYNNNNNNNINKNDSNYNNYNIHNFKHGANKYDTVRNQSARVNQNFTENNQNIIKDLFAEV